MTNITLFHIPRACSRVTMTALEEIGLDFTDYPLDPSKNQQKEADYIAINPMGRVPALKIGERVFTENAAILYYLHGQYPSSGLLPKEGSDIGVNEGLQDLVWCASTLHPITRQVRMPMRFTAENPEGVRVDGIAKYQPILEMVTERVSGNRWWYGDRWSIVDMYIFWNISTAANGGLDVSAYPDIVDHAKRLRKRPSFVKMLVREKAAAAKLGIVLPDEVLV
ncbi:glutathione S-transferase family protein [Kordiimonas pumila]|uniref:Glutathione S-transferase family protein n=1 Tax=Kordiimonas pumila TaxID=2161677 RepID=A0ABV7D8L4_9PROT|nr:glutathione S-transferase family protein [Kordiimonas pumila]